MTVANPTTFAYTIYVTAFVWGAIWGSFLNVVIYRVPAGLSVVRPPSRCPKCETQLAAKDNVPILGWLWLRGKCRYCKVPIPIRYPAVELLTGLLSLALAIHIFGDGRLDDVIAERAGLDDLIVPYFILFTFLAALIALFFIDLDTTELPPEITIPGILLGLAYAVAVPEAGVVYDLVPNVGFVDALLGAIIGGGLILTIIIVYYFLRGIVGMGGGDIYLMAMVGAFLGWQGLFFIFFASSVQGIVAAAAAVALGEKAESLFRNDEIDEMNRELKEGKSDDTEGTDPKPEAASAKESTPDEKRGEDEDNETSEDDESFGGLAIPFGPFIALSAVEYIFFGEYLLPLITSGALSPAGLN